MNIVLLGVNGGEKFVKVGIEGEDDGGLWFGC